MQSHKFSTIIAKEGRKLGEPDACEPFLNEVELAELLRCSPRTVATNRLAGRGPAYCKVGRLVRYRWSDVQAWLAARAVAADTRRKPAA